MAPYWGAVNCPKAKVLNVSMGKFERRTQSLASAPSAGNHGPSQSLYQTPTNLLRDQILYRVNVPPRLSARLDQRLERGIERSTFDNIGSRLLKKPLRPYASFFIPRKQDEIGSVDLDPLPHNEYSDCLSMTVDEWVRKYVRPQFESNFQDNVRWEIGNSWQKQRGLRRIPLDNPEVTIYDLFFQHAIDSPKARKSWSVDEGHIVVWISFQVEDPNLRAASKSISDSKRKTKNDTSHREQDRNVHASSKSRGKRKRNASPDAIDTPHRVKKELTIHCQSSRRSSFSSREGQDEEQDREQDEGQDEGEGEASTDTEAARGPAYNTRHLQKRRL
ncbi:hypothetical protein HRG_014519 [Hirsutella rhossiliensis]